MSNYSDKIVEALMPHMQILHRYELLFQQHGFDSTPTVIVRCIGNLSEPNSDTYGCIIMPEDQSPYIMFNQVYAENLDSVICTAEAENFIFKNTFGKTYNDLWDDIHEVELPNPHFLRNPVSMDTSEIVSPVMDALISKVLVASELKVKTDEGDVWRKFYSVKNLPLQKMLEIGPEKWEQIVTEVNQVNDKLSKELLENMFI